MFASISFQRVKNITALTYSDLASTPLFISFESVENDESGDHYSRGEVCLHLEDMVLAEALVEAINAVVADHRAKQQEAKKETALEDFERRRCEALPALYDDIGF